MKKIIFFTFSLLFLSSCSSENNTSSKLPEKKLLNVVYIMADDHAYQAISAYGSKISELAPTPNIDRIADGGALMDAVYCTNSICGPSRASILTGNLSHINGFYKNVDGGDFDGSQLTFPKIFQQNGYETAGIGKWHLGTTPTGFDYSKVLVNWGGQGTYFHPQFCINGKDTITEKTRHSTKVIEDDCVNWLSSRDTSKPFMLMYQFKAPHRDWRPDSIYHELFSDFDFPEPETFNDNYFGRMSSFFC
ncbi:MAG: sulfatase-like hydrolase/transferase, partial [Flavobacteriales bacterium]|nr:sulfatase-like hydrolase/transferase [Flavobacteriales bacterium]